MLSRRPDPNHGDDELRQQVLKRFSAEVNGVPHEIVVHTPCDYTVALAECYGRAIYRDAVANGTMTSAQAEKVIREKGLREPDLVSQVQNLTDSVARGEKTLKDESVPFVERRAIAEQMSRDRGEARYHRLTIAAVIDETAEARAKQARFDFICSCCLMKKDGKPFFPNVPTYIRERDAGHPVAHRGHWALAEKLYGIREDFERHLPENMFLLAHPAC